MKVLVIQPKIGMGDMVIYLPYIHAISKKYQTPVSILVKEIKYKLDNYLTGVKLLALPSVTDVDETRTGGVRGGKVPNPNPQVFTPPPPNLNGSDDPPSPTGSVDPPQPPAYFFNNPITFQEVNPNRLIASGYAQQRADEASIHLLELLNKSNKQDVA